jgi:hypothetical protein
MPSTIGEGRRRYAVLYARVSPTSRPVVATAWRSNWKPCGTTPLTRVTRS